jgi:hypothetical protein
MTPAIMRSSLYWARTDRRGSPDDFDLLFPAAVLDLSIPQIDEDSELACYLCPVGLPSDRVGRSCQLARRLILDLILVKGSLDSDTAFNEKFVA